MPARALTRVPAWVHALLVAALAVQIAVHAREGPPSARSEALADPASAAVLRLASAGEPQALAQLALLYLQAFDYRPGTRVPYRELDYEHVIAWLSRSLELDPRSQYALTLATKVYADVPDAAKKRRMLEFVYAAYLLDPEHRWAALAHATIVAKHQLKDLPLARKYAAALQSRTTAAAAPLWVRQMEAFILEDMDELEAARILLGGMIASGQVKDRTDLRFLEQHLRALEARLAAQRGDATSLRRKADEGDQGSTESQPQTP